MGNHALPRQAIRAYLGLGSNLGDRLANLQAAVDRLAACEDLTVLRSSRVYETSPVGPPQPDYLNAVVDVQTTLEPGGLLQVCLAVESEMGRERGERWGPRVIDIDVLTYGEREIGQPDLAIPHPRMHERAFVLAPLAELTTDPPLPGRRRLAALRLGSSGPTGVWLFAPPLHLR